MNLAGKGDGQVGVLAVRMYDALRDRMSTYSNLLLSEKARPGDIALAIVKAQFQLLCASIEAAKVLLGEMKDTPPTLLPELLKRHEEVVDEIATLIGWDLDRLDRSHSHIVAILKRRRT